MREEISIDSSTTVFLKRQWVMQRLDLFAREMDYHRFLREDVALEGKCLWKLGDAEGSLRVDSK